MNSILDKRRPKKNKAEQPAMEPETPTRQLAQLEVKSTRVKRPRLPSSKSLTQLVPRSLFFTKKADQPVVVAGGPVKLTTSKSFPTTNTSEDDSSTNVDDSQIWPEISDEELDGPSAEAHATMAASGLLARKLSARRSAAKVFGPTKPEQVSSQKAQQQQQQQQQNAKRQVAKRDGGIAEGGENGWPNLEDIINPIKQKFLSLRGNNQPRCRSKQPFAKLTNELASPSPTKLYSPFGIETPDHGGSEKANQAKGEKQASKSKRKLDLERDSKRLKTPDCPPAGSSLGTRVNQLRGQANRDFTFDSPTGKFRETVDYVKQSQQDLEELLKTITSRRAAANISNSSSGSR